MIDLVISQRHHCQIPEVISLDKKTFEVGEHIASGGNSQVYECIDTNSDEICAIKFHTKLNKKRLGRFEREQHIHSIINHEHIVRYIAHGEVKGNLYKHRKSEGEKGIPFVVMDRCDLTLQELLQTPAGKVPYHDYIAQFRGLTQALGLLHKHAIHRDIKPTNILIKNGVWKLSDFGLCSYTNASKQEGLTEINEKIGPMNWMSPESNTIFSGFESQITTQSDVFQLASIFWLVVNHRHPTGVLTESDWAGPKNLYLPIIRSLQHDKERRYENGEAFHSSLIQAIEHTHHIS